MSISLKKTIITATTIAFSALIFASCANAESCSPEKAIKDRNKDGSSCMRCISVSKKGKGHKLIWKPSRHCK